MRFWKTCPHARLSEDKTYCLDCYVRLKWIPYLLKTFPRSYPRTLPCRHPRLKGGKVRGGIPTLDKIGGTLLLCCPDCDAFDADRREFLAPAKHCVHGRNKFAMHAGKKVQVCVRVGDLLEEPISIVTAQAGKSFFKLPQDALDWMNIAEFVPTEKGDFELSAEKEFHSKGENSPKVHRNYVVPCGKLQRWFPMMSPLKHAGEYEFFTWSMFKNYLWREPLRVTPVLFIPDSPLVHFRGEEEGNELQVRVFATPRITPAIDTLRKRDHAAQGYAAANLALYREDKLVKRATLWPSVRYRHSLQIVGATKETGKYKFRTARVKQTHAMWMLKQYGPGWEKWLANYRGVGGSYGLHKKPKAPPTENHFTPWPSTAQNACSSVEGATGLPGRIRHSGPTKRPSPRWGYTPSMLFENAETFTYQQFVPDMPFTK